MKINKQTNSRFDSGDILEEIDTRAGWEPACVG